MCTDCLSITSLLQVIHPAHLLRMGWTTFLISFSMLDATQSWPELQSKVWTLIFQNLLWNMSAGEFGFTKVGSMLPRYAQIRHAKIRLKGVMHGIAIDGVVGKDDKHESRAFGHRSAETHAKVRILKDELRKYSSWLPACRKSYLLPRQPNRIRI